MELDASTVQWREMFAGQMAGEFRYTHEKLDGISKLLERQNGRLRALEISMASKADADAVEKNKLAIAHIKTWTAIVGGGMGLISLAALLLGAIR